MCQYPLAPDYQVHCQIGSLESVMSITQDEKHVHCQIGSLENTNDNQHRT